MHDVVCTGSVREWTLNKHFPEVQTVCSHLISRDICPSHSAVSGPSRSCVHADAIDVILRRPLFLPSMFAKISDQFKGPLTAVAVQGTTQC